MICTIFLGSFKSMSWGLKCLPPFVDVGSFDWGSKCLLSYVGAWLFGWGLKCLPPFVGVWLFTWGLKCLPPFVDVGWSLKYLVGRIWDCDVATAEFLYAYGLQYCNGSNKLGTGTIGLSVRLRFSL